MFSSNLARRAGVVLFAFIALFAAPAQAAHTGVKIIFSHAIARPGDTVLAGVQLDMEPGWHTYWKNPGAAGQATEIKWQLPDGVSAGEIQWPLPKKISVDDITTYGYEGSVVLLVPLTLAKNIPAGQLDLAAKVSWLECKESCIPAGTDVKATLMVGAEARPAAEDALLKTWQAKVPQLTNHFTAVAFWRGPAKDNTRPLVIEVDWAAPGAAAPHKVADFFPGANDDYEIQGATEIIEDNRGELELSKPVKKFAGDWPEKISGVLIADDTAYELNLAITQLPMQPATVAGVPANTPPLWRMLLYAFIGGLILNVMPCVLPVIALKILGFVSEAKSEPRRIRLLGLVYGLGVLASFLALAAVIISVKAAGHKAGWGMQFGNPIFLVGLVTLVTLVALNLFGIFEVTLGGGVLDKAGALSAKPGAAGAFFNGVLATALATPCTAPFLSIALGFAFAQSAGIILLIFSMVAAGLAAPYVLLTWNPGWLKFLPKPGAWMEKFKMAMAFPMFLTAVWLFNLSAENYNGRIIWLGVFLVLVACAAWVYGEFIQRGRTGHLTAGLTVAGLLAFAYIFVLEKQLHWRQPVVVTTSRIIQNAEGIEWLPWSAEAVDQARAAGHPVLVDFTADWCLTCQVNKKTSIEIAAVREKIKSGKVVAFVGDYTHFPDAITTELNRFNRAGVPLVLVFPKDPTTQPIVLPEVLTPRIVLDALQTATE